MNLWPLGRAVLVGAVLSCASACSDEDSPTAPSSATSPITETFSSTVARNGASYRQFTASSAGTVSLTLTSTNPEDLQLGVAIGVPATGTGGCDLTAARATPTGSNPQLQATVDAGTYCAGVYDPGTVATNQASFALVITYP